MRVDWIDISKGVAITLVVLGHIIILIPNLSVLSNMIHLFHVPLFFFISGFLFRPEKKQVKYIIKKMWQLIMPYFTIFLFLAPFVLFFESGNLSEFPALVKKYIWGGEQLKVILRGFFIPMWFLPVLFLTLVAYNFLRVSVNNETVIHITVFVLYIMSFLHTLYFRNFLLPWSAQTVILSIPILHLGYIYKRINKINLTIFILGILALLSPVFISNNSMSISNSDGGIFILTILSSILVILSLIYISKKMSKSFIGLIFKKLGEASLIIMSFHFPVYLYFFYSGLVHLDSKCIYLLVVAWTIIVLLICSIIYSVLNKFKITKLLFLGKGFPKNKRENTI